ncbi:MFS domain-containing protein, partial [Haematococcus lacustris]
MSGVFINISTTTIATTDFTGNAYLATIPIGAQLLGAAACLVPLGRLAQSRGRRSVYIGAALMAAAGSAVLVAGAVRRQFGLLVLGALMQGPSFAVANGFRFVAAEFFTGER